MGISTRVLAAKATRILGVAIVVSAFCASAFAQIDLGGGTSMMNDLGFLKNLASTGQDIMFLAAKLIGAGLCLMGIKNIGTRDWGHAIPALVGGAALFFLPSIVAAFAKMGGG